MTHKEYKAIKADLERRYAAHLKALDALWRFCSEDEKPAAAEKGKRTRSEAMRAAWVARRKKAASS